MIRSANPRHLNTCGLGEAMSRKRFSERDVMESLIRQGVSVFCYRCKREISATECRAGMMEREHLIEIALGGPDAPTNCVYSHKSCHAIVTNGTKATTAGSSKQRIAKVRRLRNPKPSRHPMSKSNRKIPSRPFQKGRA